MILREIILIFKLVRTLKVHSRAFYISKHFKTIPLFMKTTVFLVCISKIWKSSGNQKFFGSQYQITLTELKMRLFQSLFHLEWTSAEI